MDPNLQLKELKNGNKDVLSQIYLDYRNEFVNWLKSKYSVETEEGLELYQQTILIFYENVLKGKLVKVSSGLKTYLFAIGKNKMMEESRSKLRVVHSAPGEVEVQYDSENEDKVYLEQRILNLRNSFRQLGEHCRQLLQLFYYQRLSLDEIVALQGYKNRNTAKNQKYKCMEKLRGIHKKQTSETYE